MKGSDSTVRLTMPLPRAVYEEADHFSQVTKGRILTRRKERGRDAPARGAQSCSTGYEFGGLGEAEPDGGLDRAERGFVHLLHHEAVLHVAHLFAGSRVRLNLTRLDVAHLLSGSPFQLLGFVFQVSVSGFGYKVSGSGFEYRA